MNERGYAALVEAALLGVPQLRGVLSDGDARCALGVLRDAYRARCPMWRLYDYAWWLGEFAIDDAEHRAIVNANDILGWGFMQIAQFYGPRSNEREPELEFLREGEPTEAGGTFSSARPALVEALA